MNDRLRKFQFCDSGVISENGSVFYVEKAARNNASDEDHFFLAHSDLKPTNFRCGYEDTPEDPHHHFEGFPHSRVSWRRQIQAFFEYFIRFQQIETVFLPLTIPWCVFLKRTRSILGSDSRSIVLILYDYSYRYDCMLLIQINTHCSQELSILIFPGLARKTRRNLFFSRSAPFSNVYNHEYSSSI